MKVLFFKFISDWMFLLLINFNLNIFTLYLIIR